MVVFPNAKVNLGLNVTERRSDGYHNIESVMIGVDWCDILEIVPSKSGVSSLTVSGKRVDCPEEKNLVMKALNAVSEEVSVPPVDIFLHKIIPDGAGLGGGSSDAAFTIKTLNELFELNLSKVRMAEIASRIGADCPFFIYDKPMLAEGIGTTLTPVDLNLNEYKVLIVKPDVSVSTAEAYSGIVPCKSENNLLSTIKGNPKEWVRSGLKNDFEKSVFPKAPIIGQIKDKLNDSGAVFVSMSGSGSAVFAVYDDVKLAENAYKQMDKYTVFLGNFI